MGLDVHPFHLEPRGERLGRGRKLSLERIDADEAPVGDLVNVHVHRAIIAPVIDPAELVLGADRAELRAVLELVQVYERAFEPELLLEAPRDGLAHLLAAPRMRAAGV